MKWESCTYFEDIETTVKATWTFTGKLHKFEKNKWHNLKKINSKDPDTWKSPIIFNGKSIQVPVEMTLEGKTDEGMTWTEKYEYTSFRPYIAANSEIFEVIQIKNKNNLSKNKYIKKK